MGSARERPRDVSGAAVVGALAPAAAPSAVVVLAVAAAAGAALALALALARWWLRQGTDPAAAALLRSAGARPSVAGGPDPSPASVLADIRSGVFARPFARLPVAVDLPRFASKMRIEHRGGGEDAPRALAPGAALRTEDDGARWVRGGEAGAGVGVGTAPPRRNLLPLLSALADAAGEAEADVAALRAHACGSDELWARDAGLVLARLLQEEITARGRYRRLEALLRCCNQCAVAPAVVRLKTAAGARFPYRDERGGWFIDVIRRFGDGHAARVCVRHHKREVSAPGVEAAFRFRWEMVVELAEEEEEEEEEERGGEKALVPVHAHVAVVEMGCSAETSAATRAALLHAFAPFITEDTAIFSF